ncbi:MAG: hypothetical protein JWQ72_1606 [Polaromonas sp.]|nr:hypothetical protein [Polaromonas sp.]
MLARLLHWVRTRRLDAADRRCTLMARASLDAHFHGHTATARYFSRQLRKAQAKRNALAISILNHHPKGTS